ncbi:MAG: type II CAAX endopeptidase family protein [Anaerolineae bacterium]
MRQHPLFSFFFMAYAFTWIIFIPYVLSQWGILPNTRIYVIFHVLHTFGPTLSAIIMINNLEGKAGILRLWQRIRRWRAPWQWYLFIVVGIPVLIMLGIIVQPGALASFQGVSPLLIVSYPLTFAAVWFGGGPLGEEIGWRGFALRRMQPRYGPLWGTLLLGVLWAFWHLEDFLTPGQGGGPGAGLAAFLRIFPMFLLEVIALAIILTWVFNHTRGSIFISIAAHASINTPEVVLVPLFLAVDYTSLILAGVIGFGVTALLIVILTRGRLGYDPSQARDLGPGQIEA